VFTAQDAYEKIRAGASLLQLATGMIFQGPQSIGEINRELVTLLQRDGFATISEAIGADHL
jgi:dihydroorotate dehydrogenase